MLFLSRNIISVGEDKPCTTDCTIRFVSLIDGLAYTRLPDELKYKEGFSVRNNEAERTINN